MPRYVLPMIAGLCTSTVAFSQAPTSDPSIDRLEAQIASDTYKSRNKLRSACDNLFERLVNSQKYEPQNPIVATRCSEANSSWYYYSKGLLFYSEAFLVEFSNWRIFSPSEQSDEKREEERRNLLQANKYFLAAKSAGHPKADDFISENNARLASLEKEKKTAEKRLVAKPPSPMRSAPSAAGQQKGKVCYKLDRDGRRKPVDGTRYLRNSKNIAFAKDGLRNIGQYSEENLCSMIFGVQNGIYAGGKNYKDHTNQDIVLLLVSRMLLKEDDPFHETLNLAFTMKHNKKKSVVFEKSVEYTIEGLLEKGSPLRDMLN